MAIPHAKSGDAIDIRPFGEALTRAITITLGSQPHLLKRPVDRPSKRPKVFHRAFRYRAKSWDRARRVVAKVEWRAGELFPRVGFVVADLRRIPKRVIAFYNGRGTAEQWIKEGKNALKWTRLSCRRFKDDQVRLRLFDLAYNLANFLRQLALPRALFAAILRRIGRLRAARNPA